MGKDYSEAESNDSSETDQFNSSKNLLGKLTSRLLIRANGIFLPCHSLTLLSVREENWIEVRNLLFHFNPYPEF